MGHQLVFSHAQTLLRIYDACLAAMLEFWKRKEKRIALEWGMVHFEKSEFN